MILSTAVSLRRRSTAISTSSVREKALRRFRAGEIDVLVATDVAARGIDVEGVSHVINYQCPEDEQVYVQNRPYRARRSLRNCHHLVDWADQTRWKVINNTLGLPFERPEETYSTTASLPRSWDRSCSYRQIARSGSRTADRSDRSGTTTPARTRPRLDSSRTRRRLRNGIAVDRKRAQTRSRDHGTVVATETSEPVPEVFRSPRD